MQHPDAMRAESWYPGGPLPLHEGVEYEAAEALLADFRLGDRLATCLSCGGAETAAKTYRDPLLCCSMSLTAGQPYRSPPSGAWLGRRAKLGLRMRIGGRPRGSSVGTRSRTGIAAPGCSDCLSAHPCRCAKAGDDDYSYRHARHMGARADGSHSQLRVAGRKRHRRCLVRIAPQAVAAPERGCSKCETGGECHRGP